MLSESEDETGPLLRRFSARGASGGSLPSAGSAGGERKVAGTASWAGRDALWTDNIRKALPLKMGAGTASKPPTTIVEHLRRVVASDGHRIAHRVERDGRWQQWTYDQYYGNVMRFAKSLLALGLQRFDAVNISGFNSPVGLGETNASEWVTANMGAIVAGGVAVGVYATNTEDACQFIADNSGAKVVVVDTRSMLAKYMAIRDRLPRVQAYVVYNDAKPADAGPDVYTWEEFLSLGLSIETTTVIAAMEKQRPEHCCTLIYTSGTTGNPKGVMLSHDNLTWTAKAVLDLFAASEDERTVSYLPLSHIAAAMLDIYGPCVVGFTVNFARPDALKGSLVFTLRSVRPTIFFGVPRVYEKMQEKLLEVGRANNCVLRMIAGWAKRLGLRASRRVEARHAMPWGFALARFLVYSRVARGLGFDRCRALFSGAAPLTSRTLRYFQSLFLPINELYGMSECTGPQTVNYPGHRKSGTAGKPMPGTDMRIADPDHRGCGEICFRGRNCFMGYLQQAAKTAEAVSEDGFLRSGDVGYVDREGYLHITGRKKELLVTAGGENVAPVPMENVIKEELPIVSQAVLIGDGRKFVACLLTLQVRRWILVEDDFSEAGGELTPTLKLKRQVIATKYAREIGEVYGDAVPHGV